MPQLNMARALNTVLREAMREDEDVVLLGEEIGRSGGLFGVTDGLLEEFDADRVLDLETDVDALIGMAAGMALAGLRPVVELQFADSIYGGLEQLVAELGTMRYRSAGQYVAPVVVRVGYGAGVHGGIFQSASPEAILAGTPGLQVVAAATPGDAAGLLRSALRAPDPVVLLEPQRLYRGPAGEVSGDRVPLGTARIARRGADVSLFTWGACFPASREAAERAEEAGIGVEVVDLRSLRPLDVETLLGSIARTGRAVVVSAEARTGGFAAQVSATLAERALLHLEAPIARVGGLDTPVPYSLEDTWLPDAGVIVDAVERVANF